MEQPNLFVFAGPNGSGKSTLSCFMVPPDTPIFDGDKELALLRQKYPGLDSGDLYDAVNGHVFTEWKERIQMSRIDCAFETNFRSSEVMNSVREFKEKKYTTHLVFFGLDDLSSSIERVRLRAAKGGHDVSIENITANFDHGFKNLATYCTDFENVLLVKSLSTDEGKKFNAYLKIQKGLITEKAQKLPDWVVVIERAIAHKQGQSQSSNLGRDSGDDIDQHPSPGVRV